ncbi:MAG: hypothetical protein AB7C97_06015 [Oscillospiraceae bacterium]
MMDWGFQNFGKMQENWPKNLDGSPVKPVFLEFLGEVDMAAELDLNLLAAYDIPFVCMYPNNGEFGKIILGMSGTGVEIYVPETLLEDAQNIMSGNIVDETEE